MSEPKKIPISALIPDPANANKGTERGVYMLNESIAQAGLGRGVVIDKNGYLIAGNKTTEAAVNAGFEDAIIIETDGKTLLVTKRTDLDLTDHDPNNPARKLAYYDNRAGEVGLAWDAEQLLADVNAGIDLSGLFRDYELNMLTGVMPSANDPYEEWRGMPEFEQEDKSSFQSIHVHFANEDDVIAFANLIGQKLTPKTRSIWYPRAEKIDMSSEGYE